jgi:hypothetical protein
MIRNTVFICSIAFLAAWTLLSIWGMIEAFSGFNDTYASIVAANPALATEAARQSILQGVILSNVAEWTVVAVPLGLLALWAKW